MRPIWLIARTVLLEAIRRREVYVVVTAATLLVAAILSLDFFDLSGLNKFYREVTLRITSFTCVFVVIALAARQLPRELCNRTLHPILARPIRRSVFLFGKLVGVVLAALFCLALFLGIFSMGTLVFGGNIPFLLLLQYTALQTILFAFLAAFCFWLSLIVHLDAAILFAALLYLGGQILTSMMTTLYATAGGTARLVLTLFTWLLPQTDLLDLTEKTIHAEFWPALSIGQMAQLLSYGCIQTAVFFGLSAWVFSRRAL